MRLRGHCAVITGGAGGIGAACVARFMEEGAGVASLDVHETSIPGVCSLSCDVTSQEGLRAAAEKVREQIGSPDILVNCAATTVFAETIETSEEAFSRIMAVNVWGAIHASQAFAPAMRDARRGSIVTVSSITGIVGAPGMAAYAASKGALITFTRTLALELAPAQVRVNCVCPASIDTAMLQDSFKRMGDPERARANNIKRHPLGRLGSPADVANLILFLASDESSWITGSTYVIDGGASIARRWQD
jgi:NAD(P)-dependent dehydrogenase (short-subunit alcohol dehydrogenase family)